MCRTMTLALMAAVVCTAFHWQPSAAGSLTVTARWQTEADIDLVVISPTGLGHFALKECFRGPGSETCVVRDPRAVDYKIRLKCFTPRGPGATPVAVEVHRTRRKRRATVSDLMIVDDDEDFVSAVAVVLRDAGHEVRIALDTRNATQSMERQRPDLLILDVMFPENSSAGFELARSMRHFDEKLKDIRILILTGMNRKFPLNFSSRDIDKTWLPVDDFLEKPVDFDLLLTRVSALLRRAD